MYMSLLSVYIPLQVKREVICALLYHYLNRRPPSSLQKNKGTRHDTKFIKKILCEFKSNTLAKHRNKHNSNIETIK